MFVNDNSLPVWRNMPEGASPQRRISSVFPMESPVPLCYNCPEEREGKIPMQITVWTFVIVCPLIFLAGFVDSIAGGGGVISLPAYLIAGVPIKLAAGTNKFANGCGTALASYKYMKSGNINWLCAIPAAAGSLLGSAVGSSLAVYMREELLQMVVLTALPLVALILVFFRDFGREEKPPKSRRETALLSGAIGIAIGLYDGMIGPGTGTFLTIAFSAVLGYSLLKSSGCAKIANLASNVASMVVFFLHGDILFPIGIPAMACSMLGNYMGSRFAIRGGSGKIRRVMFLVLGLLFVKVGLNVLGVIDF